LKLRTKLLLLLLLVSVIPTLVVSFISFSSLANLGIQLADETSESLLADAEIHLKEIADENGKLIGLSTSQLDMAVRVQQIAAQKALTSSLTSPQQIFSVESFDDPSTAPKDLVVLPMFNRNLNDGTTIECQVSYQTQAIIRADGVSDRVAKVQANQLQLMNSMYRALSLRPGLPALRYFTATVGGMGGTFPGHGGMPDGYDPREREWYKLALKSDGEIMHTSPEVDASTLRVVIASVAPVYDFDGTLLGVTGAEKSVMDVLHEILIPVGWSNDAIIRVVVPKGEKLTVVASQDMKDGLADWNEVIKQEELYDSTESFKQLLSNVASHETGVMDYKDGEREFVVAYAPIVGMQASLVIWVPHDVIASKAIAEEAIVFERTVDHVTTIVIFSLSIILLIIIISWTVSKMVSRPIIRLTKATASIAVGNLDVEVENCGADEIGELTRHFNEMIPKLKERLELQDSLEVAKQIQQCLLPSENPTLGGWEITGKSMYCDATGGDYYDFISPPRDETHLRLVLGDVTGHGIASALMMATARSLLRGGVQCGDDPVHRLNEVNNSLVHDTPLGWFMTFFCLEIKANTSEVHWISAGHDPAIVVDIEGNVSELEGDDIPLGVTENWSFTGCGPKTIASGSVIVMGTDGIWEARNEEEEMYGKERMTEVIVSNRTKSVSDICDAIGDAVLEYCGDAPRTDDITMVVARRL
jgi:sigma-B regulation protein RsbU (phosphoserine phosphatase)